MTKSKGKFVETENPKKAFGAVKPCASYAPMNVMLGVFRVFELGAKKYGRKNWRKQHVDVSTYYNAAQRHLIEFFEQRIDADSESQQSPLAHVIACCMIILDGIERGEIRDDRGLTEVLTGKMAESAEERLRKNIDYAGGDVPIEAQPQVKVCTDDPIGRPLAAARGVPKDF
jgi:hypothetical protein